MQQATPKPLAGLNSNKEHLPTCILKENRVGRERKLVALIHTKTAQFTESKFRD